MKKSKQWRLCLTVGAVILALALVLGIVAAVQMAGNTLSKKLTLQEAQAIVDDTLASLPNSVAAGARYVVDESHVTVKDIEYGHEKDVILFCEYETVPAGAVVEQRINDYLTAAYAMYQANEAAGLKTNATKVKLLVTQEIEEDLIAAGKIHGEITLTIYETVKGQFSLYLSDDAVNVVLGGLVDAGRLIASVDEVDYHGVKVSIANKNTLRTGIKDCLSLKNYSSKKPDTSIGLLRGWNSFKNEFYRNFIEAKHWKYITGGLVTTLEITLLAVLLGIFIGFVVAVIRCLNQKTGRLKWLTAVCKAYLSIMRGTPVMVQLLIIYFVILLPIGVEKFPAAVLCFGLNSGAYVSEIVRGGIMAIDEGQTEAGRSLGFTYLQTMAYIIVPQAIKAVLPALANEFITLLKESSVAFYIGVADLTLGGLKIRSITYSNFMPLLAVAVVYLVMVLGLSKCVTLLERRLSKSDR